MKRISRCPGSGTIINAISTGYGSAFGISLDIICKIKTKSNGISCFTDKNVSTNLMELCTRNVLDYYNISEEDFGLDIKTESNLPVSSGLSSSSALSNIITATVADIISEEFNKKHLNDFEILNLAIDSSLEAKVTITGAFDDASASYFGGVTVTNNSTRTIISKEPLDEYSVLVYMPNYISESGTSDVNRMKLLAPLVNKAFEMAKSRDYFNALNMNGLIYSAALNFNSQIAVEALNAGALASGLSGTGSSFIAIVEENNIDNVKESWNLFDGKIYEAFIDNEGFTILK